MMIQHETTLHRLIAAPFVRGIGTIALVTPILALALWVLPELLNQHPADGAAAAQRLVAVNATRTAIVALLAVLAALGTLIYTVRTYGLSRTGQVTDRYTKAVEQLGSDRLEIRIGGIYALERISRDSSADQPAVIDVLGAFVRSASKRQAGSLGDKDADAPAEDMQAALTVLGRRKKHPDERRLNLRSTDLRGADLAGCDLSGARLNGARLDLARLVSADLRGAVLTGATLDGALLADAQMQEAVLDGASFRKADLYHAHLLADQLTSEQADESTNWEHAIRYRLSAAGQFRRV